MPILFKVYNKYLLLLNERKLYKQIRKGERKRNNKNKKESWSSGWFQDQVKSKTREKKLSRYHAGVRENSCYEGLNNRTTTFDIIYTWLLNNNTVQSPGWTWSGNHYIPL